MTSVHRPNPPPSEYKNVPGLDGAPAQRTSRMNGMYCSHCFGPSSVNVALGAVPLVRARLLAGLESGSADIMEIINFRAPEGACAKS